MPRYMNQEDVMKALFDALRARDKWQYSHDGSCCLYRGPNGAACFIGMLLTDEELEDPETGETFECNLEHIREALGSDDPFHMSISDDWLTNLQAIHDKFDSPEDWTVALKAFCIACGLPMMATLVPRHPLS